MKKLLFLITSSLLFVVSSCKKSPNSDLPSATGPWNISYTFSSSDTSIIYEVSCLGNNATTIGETIKGSFTYSTPTNDITDSFIDAYAVTWDVMLKEYILSNATATLTAQISINGKQHKYYHQKAAYEVLNY
jgi:hypothetical protein